MARGERRGSLDIGAHCMSIKLMALAWSTDLPVTKKMVLLALSDASDDEGVCFWSVAKLCKKCSLSERAVRYAITALEKDGWLVRDERPGRSTIYRLNVDKHTPARDAPLHVVPPAPDAYPPAPDAYPPARRAPINITKTITQPDDSTYWDENDSDGADGQKMIPSIKPAAKRFTPPTIEEVFEYCIERRNGIDAEKFIDHYTANGWRVGKNPMRDWKAAMRTWEKRNAEDQRTRPKTFDEKLAHLRRLSGEAF